jgi:hypothetical protein
MAWTHVSAFTASYKTPGTAKSKLFRGRYVGLQLFQANQAKTFIVKLSNRLNRFKGQTNVRAITAMNAIGLANELILTTRTMFCFMFAIGMFAGHEGSPVGKQQTKAHYSLLEIADSG